MLIHMSNCLLKYWKWNNYDRISDRDFKKIKEREYYCL